MCYHSIVGQLAKRNGVSCILAFCAIFSLLSGLYFLCYAEDVKDDPFKSTSSQFNFVTAGDFGCDLEPNRTIDGMIKKNPQLVIALANCWINTITPLSNDTVKLAFGDHDLTKKMKKYNDYVNHFNMTKPFYSFNYRNVHFLGMATAKNSIIPYQYGSEQYNYVREDLRRAHDNKSIDWIIVYSFRPFYSSVTSHSGQHELPDTYHRLFDEYGVDIVLQAHSHNYQRTFPLRYNETSYFPLFHPEIVSKENNLYKNPNGTIFLTIGTGGAELHNFTGKIPYIVE